MLTWTGEWMLWSHDDDLQQLNDKVTELILGKSSLIRTKSCWAAHSHLNTSDWIRNGFLSPSFLLCSVCGAAGCQRSAVLLWPQLWSPTPPIWERWSWTTTSCRIQEWSCCVILWRVQTADWRLWGQFTDSLLLICFMKLHLSSYWSARCISPLERDRGV